MTTRAASRKRPMALVTMATAVVVVGLLTAVAAKATPQTGTTVLLARIGQAAAGCSFATCMAAFLTLNGGTGGMTVGERIPTYVVRAMAVLGVAAGATLALHATMNP